MCQMLQEILPANEFYRKKFSVSGHSSIDSIEMLNSVPFTTKRELVEDQLLHSPFGTDLTFPQERYIRIHQTSGTTGNPLYWLDTEEVVVLVGGLLGGHFRGCRRSSWGSYLFCFFFWSFYRILVRLGGCAKARCHGCVRRRSVHFAAAQGYNRLRRDGARLHAHVCSAYGVRGPKERHRSRQRVRVKITIHAGEPGASIPSTKRMIEKSWGAKCFDHPGATEVGAFAFECQSGAVHVNENEFVAEILHPNIGEAVSAGEKGELVITNLGRIGSPVIRYRTGDLVQPSYQPCPCGRPFLLLQGGVLGRVDDMVIVRGVNVFPSAIENVLREFLEIEEFRVEVLEKEAMKELRILIEPRSDQNSTGALAEQVSQRVRERIGLRPSG